MSDTLVVDDLQFGLRRSAKRKTIGITIDRDGSLVLHAPVDVSEQTVEAYAREKRLWIHSKLAEKESLTWPTRKKEFVSGEGFHYLGRNYRLLLVDACNSSNSLPPLRLHQGRFLLNRDEQERGREHFIEWYTGHALPWLRRRVDLLADRVGIASPAIRVRDLSFRWASCSKGKTLNFHWRTTLLPPRTIEYIVAHELVHLHESRHSSDFWQRLERAMPDFGARKQWLSENGGGYYL